MHHEASAETWNTLIEAKQLFFGNQLSHFLAHSRDAASICSILSRVVWLQISASKASKAAPAPKKKAKAKAKRSNGKRKSRSAEDDLFQGITDFSELAAVHDFYEVWYATGLAGLARLAG